MLKPSLRLIFLFVWVAEVQYAKAEAPYSVHVTRKVAGQLHWELFKETERLGVRFSTHDETGQVLDYLRSFTCRFSDSDPRDAAPFPDKIAALELPELTEYGWSDVQDPLIATLFETDVQPGDVRCFFVRMPLPWDFESELWGYAAWPDQVEEAARRVGNRTGYTFHWKVCSDFNREDVQWRGKQDATACVVEMRANEMWQMAFGLDEFLEKFISINPNGKTKTFDCELYTENSTSMCTFDYKPDLATDAALTYQIYKPFPEYVVEDRENRSKPLRPENYEDYSYYPHCKINPKASEYKTFNGEVLAPGQLKCDIRFYPAFYDSFSEKEMEGYVWQKITHDGNATIEGSGLNDTYVEEEEVRPNITCPYSSTSMYLHLKWCVP